MIIEIIGIFVFDFRFCGFFNKKKDKLIKGIKYYYIIIWVLM